MVYFCDNKCIDIVVNIGIVLEVSGVFVNGVEGVGLFCIEMFYMDCDSVLDE